MINFDEIIPTIDKIEYTIEPKLHGVKYGNSYETLIRYLNNIFEIGKKKMPNNTYGIYYKANRIWISRAHANWYRLQFFPEVTDINRLIDILCEFRSTEDKLKWNPKQKCIILCKDTKLQNIKKAEIAFDLSFPDCEQDFVEYLSNKISQILCPIYGQRAFYTLYSSKDNLICKDEAINGKISSYWRNNRRKNDPFKPIKSSNSTECIVYPKAYTKDEQDFIDDDGGNKDNNKKIWHIRFETRLNDYRVNKIITTNRYILPYDLNLILEKLIDDKFSTYFKFIKVDYKNFKRDALNYPDINKKEFLKLYKSGINAPAAQQLYLIRAISKKLNLHRIKNNVKVYVREIEFQKVEKMIAEELENYKNSSIKNYKNAN